MAELALVGVPCSAPQETQAILAEGRQRLDADLHYEQRILLRKSYKDSQTADAVRKLFAWSLQDGQRYASELGYVPLPPVVSEKSLAAVNSVKP